MANKQPHIQHEVEEIAPGLEKHLASWKPSIPEGYFEKLQTEILAKTVDANHQSGNGRGRRIILWSIVSAAALVLLFVGIRFWTAPANSLPTFEEQLALLSSDEILDIIHEDAELPEVESILESGLIVEQEVYSELGVYEELITETTEEKVENNTDYILSEEEIQSLDEDQWLELMEGEFGL
jgi:hypothetical protein